LTVAPQNQETPSPNPLTSTVIANLLLDGFTVKNMVEAGRIEIFSILAIAQALVLLVFYLRKSRYAGSFLFWSVVPMFPIYFGLNALGFNGPRMRPLIYAVAAVFWCVGLLIVWRLKRRYIAYLVELNFVS